MKKAKRNFVTVWDIASDGNGGIKWIRVPAKFDCTEIADLIERCEKIGYSCETLEGGVLGYGKIILWAPEGYKNMIVREEPLNSWSSAHTIERFTDIYPELQKEIDDCLNAIMTALEG